MPPRKISKLSSPKTIELSTPLKKRKPIKPTQKINQPKSPNKIKTPKKATGKANKTTAEIPKIKYQYRSLNNPYYSNFNGVQITDLNVWLKTQRSRNPNVKLFDADWMHCTFESLNNLKQQSPIYCNEEDIPKFGDYEYWIIPILFHYKKQGVEWEHTATLLVNFLRKEICFYDYWNVKSPIEEPDPKYNRAVKEHIARKIQRLYDEHYGIKNEYIFEEIDLDLDNCHLTRSRTSRIIRGEVVKTLLNLTPPRKNKGLRYKQHKYKTEQHIKKEKSLEKRKKYLPNKTYLELKRILENDPNKYEIFTYNNGCGLFAARMIDQLMSKPSEIPIYPTDNVCNTLRHKICGAWTPTPEEITYFRA